MRIRQTNRYKAIIKTYTVKDGYIREGFLKDDTGVLKVTRVRKQCLEENRKLLE